MPVISIREEKKKKKKKETTLPGFEPGFLIPKICQCAAADQMIYSHIFLLLYAY